MAGPEESDDLCIWMMQMEKTPGETCLAFFVHTKFSADRYEY